MRVVALLAIRNEQLHLRRCLEHLERQGVETCLIDNDSTDNSLEIAESFRQRGVFRIERLPHTGSYEWQRILQCKEKLASEIGADWFIHHDADEIREARTQGTTLKQALEEIDRRGYNAVDFDEFVFLPTSDDENYEGRDYVAEMKHYYFFDQGEAHRITAWKNLGIPVDIATSGGHRVEFAGRSVAPEKLVMRHYIALSKRHVIAKYGGRVYSMEEVKKLRWHRARYGFSPERLVLPDRRQMKTLSHDGTWDRSDPRRRHEFLDGAAGHMQDVVRSSPRPDLKPMPFIVGVGRSGTTLLRLMLDAHPDMAVPPETHFLPSLIDQLSAAESLFLPESVKASAIGRPITHLTRAVLWRLLPASGAELTALHITRADTWRDFHLDRAVLRREMRKARPSAPADAIRRFYALYAARFGKSRYGDKTPNYIADMTKIGALLPEARFVHLVRDGRDVAASFKKVWFGRGQNVTDQAAYWLSTIRNARQQGQLLPHYMEVRFEDLVRTPEQTLRRVCDFLELPFDAAMLDYHERSRERMDELTDWHRQGKLWAPKEQRLAIFERTTAPPDESRIGAYRTDLTADEILEYEATAGDLLRDLGYLPG